jgi:hypothetical protein
MVSSTSVGRSVGRASISPGVMKPWLAASEVPTAFS